MKFKAGDILYYVNPFVYTIEQILVQFPDTNNGHQYYVDNDGALLAEWDLFERLEDAKGHALQLLEKFYVEKQNEIWKARPELHIDPED